MKKTKKEILYRIISGQDSAVELGVNKALKEGWELYGSPAMAIDVEHKIILCAQAMTKAEGLPQKPGE
jgi:hypothetical protein